MKEHFDLILAVAGVIAFIAAIIIVTRKAKKIDREGLEADAVVSKITEYQDSDSVSSSFRIYVKYTDEDGIAHESTLSASEAFHFSVGMNVRIKYLPGKHTIVRFVDYLSENDE